MSGDQPPISNEEIAKLCKKPEESTQDFMMQQTMYRIRDPRKSIPFYTGVLGMSLLEKIDFCEMKFTLYMMGYDNTEGRKLGTKESISKAFGQKATIELTHNWGTENDADFQYHNGNKDPRGFGHIGIMVPDVKKACDRFEKLGVTFIKKLGDGKMKDIAFIADPDGYWIEIFNNDNVANYVTNLNT